MRRIPLDPFILKSDISLIVSVAFITISSFISDGLGGYWNLESSILIRLDENWFREEINR